MPIIRVCIAVERGAVLTERSSCQYEFCKGLSACSLSWKQRKLLSTNTERVKDDKKKLNSYKSDKTRETQTSITTKVSVTT